MFIKSEKKLSERNKNVIDNNKVIIRSNMFEETLKGNFKEFIFIYIKPLYALYKIIISLIKNL